MQIHLVNLLWYRSNKIKLVFVTSQLSTQHKRRKSKDWMARNQDNVSKWGDMSIRRLLFQ